MKIVQDPLLLYSPSSRIFFKRLLPFFPVLLSSPTGDPIFNFFSVGWFYFPPFVVLPFPFTHVPPFSHTPKTFFPVLSGFTTPPSNTRCFSLPWIILYANPPPLCWRLLWSPAKTRMSSPLQTVGSLDSAYNLQLFNSFSSPHHYSLCCPVPFFGL